jgi:hypothetical protein
VTPEKDSINNAGGIPDATESQFGPASPNRVKALIGLASGDGFREFVDPARNWEKCPGVARCSVI